MPETDLATLQRWMSLVVQHPRVARVAAETERIDALIPSDRALHGQVVKPGTRLEPMERVDIYGNGYVARLVGALESDFPGLIHALGGSGFSELAADYVLAHPSEHANLIFLCHRLPEFITNCEGLEHREFLSDLARLEVAMTEAFHAPQAEALDLSQLETLAPEDWERVVFDVSPSLRLIEADYPVNGFLQATFDQQEPTIPEPSKSWAAVYRKDFVVWRAHLSEARHATLRALATGETFGAALQLAGSEADKVGLWFQDWSADGVICGVRIADH